MPRRQGKAAICWTSTDANSERVHWLQAPLRAIQPSHTQTVYSGESLDKSVIESVTVGEGAHEMVGTVRYDHNPQGLVDLIKEGSKNTTLTYIPNLADPDVSYSVKLISPRGLGEAGLDPQRATFGEHSVTLRLRQTDESAFRNEMFRGTDTLFWYRAGDSLEDATFTRAGTAVRVIKGYGTLTETTNDKARLEWVSTKGTSGFRDTPSLLLESSRTNHCEVSALLSSVASSGYWTATTESNSIALTSEQTDPYGTSSGWLLSDNSTVWSGNIRSTFITGLSTNVALSAYMKAGSTMSTAYPDDGTLLRLVDNDASANRCVAQVHWSSGVPSMSTNASYSRWDYAAPERCRDGWWRITTQTTGPVVSTANHYVQIVPHTISGARQSIYAFGVQVETSTG